MRFGFYSSLSLAALLAKEALAFTFQAIDENDFMHDYLLA